MKKNSKKKTPVKPSPQPIPPNYRVALEYLDKLVALAPVSRQGHIQAQQALSQLSGLIVKVEQLEAKLKNKE